MRTGSTGEAGQKWSVFQIQQGVHAEPRIPMPIQWGKNSIQFIFSFHSPSTSQVVKTQDHDA